MAYSCPGHAYQFVFVLTEKSNLLLLILSISGFEQIKLSFTVLTILKGSLSLLILSVLLRCSKELNQWEHLLEYAKTKNHVNPFLILECAWRVPDWNLMKEALNHVESNCPNDMLWKVSNNTLLHSFS